MHPTSSHGSKRPTIFSLGCQPRKACAAAWTNFKRGWNDHPEWRTLYAFSAHEQLKRWNSLWSLHSNTEQKFTGETVFPLCMSEIASPGTAATTGFVCCYIGTCLAHVTRILWSTWKNVSPPHGKPNLGTTSAYRMVPVTCHGQAINRKLKPVNRKLKPVNRKLKPVNRKLK